MFTPASIIATSSPNFARAGISISILEKYHNFRIMLSKKLSFLCIRHCNIYLILASFTVILKYRIFLSIKTLINSVISDSLSGLTKFSRMWPLEAQSIWVLKDLFIIYMVQKPMFGPLEYSSINWCMALRLSLRADLKVN